MKVSKVALCILAVALFLVVRFEHYQSQEPVSGGTFVVRPAAEVSALERALRPNYPYSVIPGGAYTRDELAARMRSDAVVAQHYLDFSVRDVKLVRLERDQMAYVSYRQKNAVFWTRRRIRLPKGEMLISDGHHFARTRCGNRVSTSPPPGGKLTQGSGPIADLSLPPFSFPLWQSGLVTPFQLPPSDVIVSPPHAPFGSLDLSNTPLVPLRNIPFPIAPVMPWDQPRALPFADLNGLPIKNAPRAVDTTTPPKGQPPPTTGSGLPPVVPPIVAVPEPGGLVFAGLIALLLCTFIRPVRLRPQVTED